jgi:hypothetical protein
MATDPLPPDDANPQPQPPERDPADTDWVTPAEGAEIAELAAEHVPPPATGVANETTEPAIDLPPARV